MYKVLLCWRYLLTRYLAFACIISVMLGVATLIVVNAVMSGFSTKLRDRLHGLLSDVVIESTGLEGFYDPQGKMARIRQDAFLKDKIVAMAETMDVPALLQFDYPNGEIYTRPVRLIGVDSRTRSDVGGFRDHLSEAENRKDPSFELNQAIRDAWLWREKAWQDAEEQAHKKLVQELKPGEVPPPPPWRLPAKVPAAAYVGFLIANGRDKDGKDFPIMHRGDTIRLSTISGGKMVPVYDQFLIKDYFHSEMSEYDGNFIFVDLAYLQKLRATPERATTLQIKLKDFDADSKAVVAALHRLFAGEGLKISTWEQKQGTLLAAIAVERAILNVLLFLIIAVAGFGILAIFSMIVAEKTRDIGILKALGASHLGVMQIFLSYGLLLGIVGCGLGTLLGYYFTIHINDIEAALSAITGSKVFSGEIYYFTEIPTNLEPGVMIGVNIGAMLIAVLFSVLPAYKAARLHPVRALRYE